MCIRDRYHFTAHVTLGYFGNVPSQWSQDADSVDRLTNLLTEFNQQWQDGQSHDLIVQRAELRKFDTMMNYYRQPNWAMLEF
jgi:hypothetical protein